jgi:hypothetical protein
MAEDNIALKETLGSLAVIQRGSMNPVMLNTSTNPSYTSADDSVTIAQKLNDFVPIGIYGTLTGIVVKTEVNESHPSFRQEQLEQTSTTIPPRIAWVFIDVLHSSITSFLDDSNYKNFLTEVEILEPIELPPQAKVQVSFKSSDYSVGTLVKAVSYNTDNSRLVPPAGGFGSSSSWCRSSKPKTSVKSASPRSTPSMFTNKNVGYVQALYELAIWQSNNPDIKILEIWYPFAKKDLHILELAKTKNEKILANLKEESNPQKQWTVVVKDLFSKISYKPNTSDPAIRISVATVQQISATAKKLNDWSIGYEASTSDNRLLLSFPKGNKKTIKESIALTKKNIGGFFDSFESVIHAKPEQVPKNTSKTTVGSSPSSTSCNPENFPIEIEGVPFIDVGFKRRAKFRRKPHLIVMHHSVTSSAKKTVSVLRSKDCSVHFNVDRGHRAGETIQHIPLNEKACHAGRLNSYSVGVENTNSTGPILSSYIPNKIEVYEAIFQLLVKLTKKLEIPFSVHEANVQSGFFYMGKFRNNEHKNPGIMAHGSDLGTTHEDGKFELLYCHLRHIGYSPSAALGFAKETQQSGKKDRKNVKVTYATKWRDTPKNRKKNKPIGQYVVGYYGTATTKLPSEIA